MPTAAFVAAIAGAFGPTLVDRQGASAQAAVSADDLQPSFRMGYPTGRAIVMRGDEEVDVVFTPKLLKRLDARTQVLISVGKAINSDCHLCQGAFSIVYLTDGALSGPAYTGFGSMGGLGAAPDVSLMTNLGPTPLLIVRNSFSNQGETEVWVDLIRLGPTRADVAPVAETVPLAFDNAGSADSCAITGRIVAKGKGGDFAVRYRGSFKGVVSYQLRDGRYVAPPETPALYERCPGA